MQKYFKTNKNIKVLIMGTLFLFLIGIQGAFAEEIVLSKNIFYNDSLGSFVFPNNVFVTGNITSNYIFGNGSLLTNLPSGTTTNWSIPVNTDIMPNQTNMWDLGSLILRFKEAFFNAITTNSMNIGNSTGNTTVTPTGTTFEGTAQPTDFLEIESLFTGTSPPATLLINTIGISRAFDDETDEQLYTHVKMPSRFAGGNVILRYTWLSTTATTGNCVWAVEYRMYKNNELQSVGTATLSETQTTKGTTYNRTTTLGFTIPNVEPTDTLESRIYRDANNGADTLVGDASLLHATIEFPISTI